MWDNKPVNHWHSGRELIIRVEHKEKNDVYSDKEETDFFINIVYRQGF